MTFGEKVRQARQAADLTQNELADKTGIARRTIINYENDERMPKKRETYFVLAKALNIEVSILLDEKADFLISAEEKYGSRAARQARELTQQVTSLYAGGELEEEDMEAMMRSIQEAYWYAKEQNRKYVPKKYRQEK